MYYNNIVKRNFKGEKKNKVKTYLINEELLKKVISTLVDYQVDLKTELEELKELTEKKTYRPCRTVQELYNLIFNIKSKVDDTEFYIDELLDVNIHFRDKETGTEYFTTISSITKDKNDYVKVVVSPKGYLSFTDLFNNYEIEVEGEFKPFGVTDET